MNPEERIERIKKMEHYYEALKEYYESGLWLSDYEADERGELPADLKRGVLSQDGLYNLLNDIETKDAP